MPAQGLLQEVELRMAALEVTMIPVRRRWISRMNTGELIALVWALRAASKANSITTLAKALVAVGT